MARTVGGHSTPNWRGQICFAGVAVWQSADREFSQSDAARTEGWEISKKNNNVWINQNNYIAGDQAQWLQGGVSGQTNLLDCRCDEGDFAKILTTLMLSNFFCSDCRLPFVDALRGHGLWRGRAARLLGEHRLRRRQTCRLLVGFRQARS